MNATRDITSRGRGPAAIARTAGRALALQLLYSFEQNHYVDDGQLVPDESHGEAGDEGGVIAKSLFDGFCAERTAVDAAVDKRLENWTIHRLAVLDRAILRLGAYELLYRPETPPKVAINEWIELAKTFGSEAKTAKLVNGVLDRIARDHELGGLKPTRPAAQVVEKAEKPEARSQKPEAKS